jgi:hypothetical protein
MKKIAVIFSALAFMVGAVAFKNPKGEICFKVKNDTGNSITLHTGKGTAPMPNGTQKEFCMEDGSTLHVAEKGKKGKIIMEVSSSASGKVIKLSSVL